MSVVKSWTSAWAPHMFSSGTWKRFEATCWLVGFLAFQFGLQRNFWRFGIGSGLSRQKPVHSRAENLRCHGNADHPGSTEPTFCSGTGGLSGPFDDNRLFLGTWCFACCRRCELVWELHHPHRRTSKGSDRSNGSHYSDLLTFLLSSDHSRLWRLWTENCCSLITRGT